MEQKVVLITGISSGFGKSTAEYLAQKGYIIYGTSRKTIEVDNRINVLKADVTDVVSVKAAVETILKKEGRIDILINNAGMGISGPIEFASADDFNLQMETNFIGMVKMIQFVLPALRKQKGGTIINISSIGGLMGLPFQGFYSASKYAIEGMSEALRMELKPFQIKVVVVRPGDFHTGFTSNRKVDFSLGENNPYTAQFQKAMSIIETDEKGGLKPEYFARKIGKIIGLKHPDSHYVIATFEQKFAVILKRLLPDSLFSGIIGSHYGIK